MRDGHCSKSPLVIFSNIIMSLEKYHISGNLDFMAHGIRVFLPGTEFHIVAPTYCGHYDEQSF